MRDGRTEGLRDRERTEGDGIGRERARRRTGAVLYTQRTENDFVSDHVSGGGETGETYESRKGSSSCHAARAADLVSKVRLKGLEAQSTHTETDVLLLGS
jgi:hypothetical protein